MSALHSYPCGELNVTAANSQTVEFFAASGCRSYAELGVYEGDTALAIATSLGGAGELHLFDFQDRVEAVAGRLRRAGYDNVFVHANSRRLLDSYNWSLMQLLAEQRGPIFDYVFVDGAHTWAHDALAFLLVDRLLRPGGYVDFDDYTWTLRASPSMNPAVFPEVERLYTDEQIDTAQVALVVDLLLKLDPTYEEIVPNKIFRRLSA
jgi:predicted O-methyltransferase YrrM